MARRCIKKKLNKRGIAYALVSNGDETFSVLKLCENYAGHVRGGIAKTWRYVSPEKMNEAEALKVYARRSK